MRKATKALARFPLLFLVALLAVGLAAVLGGLARLGENIEWAEVRFCIRAVGPTALR